MDLTYVITSIFVNYVWYYMIHIIIIIQYALLKHDKNPTFFAMLCYIGTERKINLINFIDGIIVNERI